VTQLDALTERRRLRRRLAFWRIAAVLALAAMAAALLWRAPAGGTYVARHELVGLIVADDEQLALLRAIARDEDAQALVLRINSPGGTVAGSEALYAAIRAVAAEKPVVAVMGETAASGGYVAALAADRLYARGGTLTGSIGVVAHYPNVDALLDRIGVDVAQIASGPLKAEPSPFSDPSRRALDWQEALIADSHAWFLALVAERRGFSAARARELGDGRAFTGRQALAAELIDEIGGEAEARDWLDAARGVSAALPTRTLETDDGAFGLLDLVAAAPEARLQRLLAAVTTPRLMAILH
jgi:protease-4